MSPLTLLCVLGLALVVAGRVEDDHSVILTGLICAGVALADIIVILLADR